MSGEGKTRCRMLWMIQCVNDLKCVFSSCPCRSFSVCWKSIMSRWCLEQIRFSGYDTCYDAIMFPDSSFSSPLCPGGWLAVSGVSDSGRAQSQRGAATRFLCGGSPHSPLRDCSSGREMNGKRIQTKPNNCTSQRLRLQSCAVNIRIFRELNAFWSSSKRASRSSPAWICWTRLAVSISIHQSQKLTVKEDTAISLSPTTLGDVEAYKIKNIFLFRKMCLQVEQLMEQGTRTRTTAATHMNANSSRSHMLIILQLKQVKRFCAHFSNLLT